MPIRDPQPAIVYLLYDDQGELLYVGMAHDPLRRWMDHRSRQPWWSDVARFEIRTYPSWEEAAIREADAIAHGRPRYNILGNQGRQAPPDADLPAILAAYGSAGASILDLVHASGLTESAIRTRLQELYEGRAVVSTGDNRWRLRPRALRRLGRGLQPHRPSPPRARNQPPHPTLVRYLAGELAAIKVELENVRAAPRPRMAENAPKPPPEVDPLFGRVATLVAAEGMASVSFVQRKVQVGYSRAGRIVDQLAEHGVIGRHQGSKPREVLMVSTDVDALLQRLGVEKTA